MGICLVWQCAILYLFILESGILVFTQLIQFSISAAAVIRQRSLVVKFSPHVNRILYCTHGIHR